MIRFYSIAPKFTITESGHRGADCLRTIVNIKDHNLDIAKANNAIIETSKYRRNTSLIPVYILKSSLFPSEVAQNF